jgi:outer membrane protein
VVAQEIAADNDLRVKRLALDTLVGKDTQPVPLASPLNVPGAQPAESRRLGRRPRTPAPRSCRRAPASTSPNWKTEKARAGHKPTLDLTASYNVTRNPSGTATIGNSNRTNIGQVGVTFNLPLFAGFATQNRCARRCRWKTRPAPTWRRAPQVAQATRAAYFGVVSGQGQVKALEAAEPRARARWTPTAWATRSACASTSTC